MALRETDNSSQLSSSRLVLSSLTSVSLFLFLITYLIFTELQQETDDSPKIIQLQPLRTNG